VTTTYAVTGSSGYIGTRTIRWLLDADPDHRVIGFDVRPPRIADARLEHHELDVRDPRVGERLAGRDVRALLHFAFIVDPLYDEREMTDIDVGGTRNLLEAARAARVRYLLATSSTTAYGALPDNPVPLREEHPTRAAPAFVYAHDKRQMDEMLRAFAAANPEIGVCIVRPCIVLGPTVSNYIAANLLTQPVASLIDGRDPPLQFIHEDDLARFIAGCVEREATGVYNAVGEGYVTGTEAARIQKKPAWPVPRRLAAAILWGAKLARLTAYQMPPGILDFYAHPWVASGDKARRELGFEPAHSSRQCLEIILARRGEIREAFRRQMAARGKR
jgi:UDP-glucose 4-epimerase